MKYFWHKEKIFEIQNYPYNKVNLRMSNENHKSFSSIPIEINKKTGVSQTVISNAFSWREHSDMKFKFNLTVLRVYCSQVRNCIGYIVLALNGLCYARKNFTSPPDLMDNLTSY